MNSKQYKYGYQATLFEINDPQYAENKTVINGKIFTLTTDRTHDGKIDIKDLEWHYLEGDGDFKSEEIKRLRDEADKQFVIIGIMNAITYKEVFPLIKNDKMWLGNGFHAGNAYFSTPFANEYAEGIYNPETGLVKFRNVCWFTNLDHGRRHQPLPLMSMIDNLRFSKHKEIKGKESYDKYDNYYAIELPFTDAIPSDYDGAMGVPISFLDKYSPEQFEIMGITDRDNNSGLKTREYTEDDVPNPGDLNRRGVIKIGSEYKSTYARLLIRRKPKK